VLRSCAPPHALPPRLAPLCCRRRTRAACAAEKQSAARRTPRHHSHSRRCCALPGRRRWRRAAGTKGSATPWDSARGARPCLDERPCLCPCFMSGGPLRLLAGAPLALISAVRAPAGTAR
jgi:hypothetical protein